MPSPFPGMDPYLEDPARWPGVHQSFITYTRDAMQPALRSRYHALIGERIYLIEPPQSRYPDMIFVRRPVASEPWGEGGVATAEVDAPVLVEIPPQEIREVFIEIVHMAGTEVVTIIEVLSPSNKMPGEGQDLYLRKQQQLLSSQVHLVEIDLLRSGSHTLALPQHVLAELAEPWHYLVSVRRAPLTPILSRQGRGGLLSHFHGLGYPQGMEVDRLILQPHCELHRSLGFFPYRSRVT